MTPGVRRGQAGPVADPAPEIAWADHPEGWLRWGLWNPPGEIRTTCLLLPGRTEPFEKYDHVAARLIRQGHQVVALDWFGQGLSGRPLTDPRRHHVTDWLAQGRDIDRVMIAAGLASAGRPIWALSHSMGGTALAARLADPAPLPAPLCAAVMVAPLFGLPWTEGIRGRLVSLLASWGCRLGLSARWLPGQGPWNPDKSDQFDGNPLTHDQKRFDRMIADFESVPGLAIGGVTWGWLASLLTEFRRLEESGFGRIGVPVTLLMADQERVVSNLAIQRATELIPSAMLVPVAGAEHEILMELAPIAEPVWSALLAVADGLAGGGGPGGDQA